jgi:hypothetical protein
MDMRVPPGIVTKGLDGHNHPGFAGCQTKAGAKKLFQALFGTMAEAGQQFSIIEKIAADDDGNTENILAVVHRKENILPEMNAELYNFFSVATGTKPSTPTTEGKKDAHSSAR